ncbi:nucleoside hydrolase [Poriferisphaera sp. WC338]|uniref:nucleoside hydrolase n=1 Tax=Poriferisphaera sp. WC338 TaxID=3425129 RepID=UPI003D81822C
MSNHPVPIIVDTDMGNDIDDALAFCMLYALEARQECRVLATTVCKDNPFAPQYVDVINTFYGRHDVPIGMVSRGVTCEDGLYNRAIVERTSDGQRLYDRKASKKGVYPDAIETLRRTLAKQSDRSVVLATIGFMTNTCDLLQSEPDEYSSLSGRELVRQKVKAMYTMAGDFSETALSSDEERFKEYNIYQDIASAQYTFEHWPTPIYFSGVEVGKQVLFPADSIIKDFAWAKHHPVVDAYKLYLKMPYDRPTWDLLTILAAIRPQYDYFQWSSAGDVRVRDNGTTSFDQQSSGQHYYMSIGPDQIFRLQELLRVLSSQPRMPISRQPFLAKENRSEKQRVLT